ncbi:hypothetical protein [Methylobacterium sp. R2-1]|uniref:hypothetical protein n=1 Tax=Methylobacterium sp. R2-1 TaxID=2587064 RepID=UPI00185D3513|nr:hypothetical protein [Methylobacterium sp. R2-1]MBB2962597.1 hypothetical protein [Methylobacterium sp. R2-1]
MDARHPGKTDLRNASGRRGATLSIAAWLLPVVALVIRAILFPQQARQALEAENQRFQLEAAYPVSPQTS